MASLLYGIANPRRIHSQTVGQSSQGIPQFPGALRPADLRIVPSLSFDLLSCQLNYLRASPFHPPKKLGLQLNDQQTLAVLNQVKLKSHDLKRVLTEKEFKEIVNRLEAGR